MCFFLTFHATYPSDTRQRMKESSFYSLCLTMWQIPQEFVKLQVSQEEFLCMKVLLLLNTSEYKKLFTRWFLNSYMIWKLFKREYDHVFISEHKSCIGTTKVKQPLQKGTENVYEKVKLKDNFIFVQIFFILAQLCHTMCSPCTFRKP